MSKSIKLSNEIIEDATLYAHVFSRSISKQIEHWSKIGKIAEENPDLNYNFIKEIMLSLEEKNVEEYKFGNICNETNE